MQPLKTGNLSKTELVSWILDYRDGDLEAFDKFYAATKPVVLAFLRRYLRSEEDVNEAFQDVYFRLHRYVRGFKPELNPVAWLLTIAKNAAVDIGHNAYQAKKVLGERIPFDESIFPSSPHESEFEDEQRVLTRLMAELPNKDQAILTSRLIDGTEYDEIGKRMNLGAESVRQRFSRAIKRLRSSAS